MIAWTFHFPPSEIWEMEIEELLWWLKRADNLTSRAGTGGAGPGRAKR